MKNKIEERAKEAIEEFKTAKKEIEFGREDFPEEDEKKFREFHKYFADKGYEIVTIIGAKEHSMCGLSGNMGALRYILTESLMSDSDLREAVNSAMFVMEGLRQYVQGDYEKRLRYEKDKAN